MIRTIKRVAAIHDLSGFGRASLTAIIPVLSTMGVQVCPVPTAVLSSHTGDFNDFSFVDLTDSLEAYIAQWKKLELEFDCIYSGFLGSVKQIDIVEDFIRHFKTKESLVVVDPVMGDNGNLYSTMGPAMVREMRSLIGMADIITPNFTEAAFLLDRPYTDYIDDVSVKEWAIRLSEMGPATVVITSVPDHRDNADTSVIAYDRTNQICWKISCRYIPAHYPGTGDTFTSVVIGGLLQGDSLPIALDRGVLFISQCIKASYGFNYPKREGVLLERCLDILKAPAVIGAFETL